MAISNMRMRLAAIAMVCCLVQVSRAAAGSDVESAEFQQVIQIHLDRYPELEMQDLYKLVFQAAMGSEHAVSDREGARQWLIRELSTLANAPPQPLTEPLSPDGTLVRINLRTFVEEGGRSEDLLEAFVASAAQYLGSKEDLRRYWNQVEAMAESGSLPFDVLEMKEYFAEMESQGLRAVRHSDRYRERYSPAYRVVLLKFLEPESIAVTAE
jgi:hypothetical protein